MFEARCQGGYRVSLRFGFGDGLWGENPAGGEAGAEPELGTGQGALPSTFSIILLCARLFPCLPTLFCTCQLLLPLGAFHLGPS